ncbi:MAG: hypothetical protein DCC73_05745 [Proteobacteria bacterium]|jgi:tryptophan-rich sensory protein|nr:MAG: hypothetical protein DCC73_05745 [Pseudomonadota bacterium]
MLQDQPKPAIGLWGLPAAVALTLGVGVLSALAGGSGPSPWYDALVKSPLNPPATVFALVWPMLYGLMGLSLWLLLREPESQLRRKALTWFFIQLAVNAVWSWVFFDRHWLGLAVIHVAVLGACVIAFMAAARKISSLAALLNAPYLAWLTFAFYLALEVWRLNR